MSLLESYVGVVEVLANDSIVGIVCSDLGP